MPLDHLIPEVDARKIVLRDVAPRSEEIVQLASAHGRILSKDLVSLRTQPPFDASAMDGYAVKQSDIENLPAKLKVIGTSRAGEPFNGVVSDGEAVRILTGAVVPRGVDSIVIQENVTRSADIIEVKSGVPVGKFVRRAGMDFKEGERLLSRNDTLTANRLALAASMNHSEVSVFQKPRVALISTGDELVYPGELIGQGQIIASNTFGLIAAASECGAEVMDLGIVADTKEALASAFENAISNNCDLIVTTGGASVGDHDLVMPVAEDLGFEFKIAKIAMRPGKPFLFGILPNHGKTIRLTGLAGNPVSSLVAFSVFVRPLIQLLSGRAADEIIMQTAKLGCDLPENDERAEYMRASLHMDSNGEVIATPFEKQDSSMLANLVRADCLVYREVNARAAHKGSVCQFLRL